MTTRITLLILALASFTLPFVVGHSAALSFNLYDLAEWTTLLPSERASNPPLLLSLLLRLHLVLLVWVVMLMTIRSGPLRPWATLVIVILALAQMPPLEILTSPADPNYQQQQFCVILSLAAIPAQYLRRLNDYAQSALRVIAFSGLLFTVLALPRVYQALADYYWSFTWGPALAALVLLYLVLLFAQQKRAPQRSS